MIVRLIIGALVSAVILMGWGFLFWAVLPLHQRVMHALPNEQRTLLGLAEDIHTSGVYLAPWRAEPGNDPGENKEAEETWKRKQSEGPIVQIIYRKDGTDPRSPITYALGFA